MACRQSPDDERRYPLFPRYLLGEIPARCDLGKPTLKARIPVGNDGITVFDWPLKSRLGELDRPKGAGFPLAANSVNYDPAGRALESFREGLRRIAEAWILRSEILKEREAGNPVMVLGDFNDSENEIIQEKIDRVRLHSAKKRFVRKSLRDMVFTSAFGGVYESIDQLLMLRYFHPDNAERLGQMAHFLGSERSHHRRLSSRGAL